MGNRRRCARDSHPSAHWVIVRVEHEFSGSAYGGAACVRVQVTRVQNGEAIESIADLRGQGRYCASVAPAAFARPHQ